MFTNQSKDIDRDIESIHQLAAQVSKASERRPPKAYRAQCISLTERIMVIKEAIAGLKGKKPNQGNISQALSALKSTLEEAEDLISKLSSDSFFNRVFRADYPSQFTRINTALTESMQQLNLALAVKKMIDPEQDKRDREEDYKALLAQQGEMIAMARATQQKIELLDAKEAKREETEVRREEDYKALLAQQNEMIALTRSTQQKIEFLDGKERKLEDAEARREEVLSKKIASIQQALENLSPTAIVAHHSKQIPAHLKIPFFELEVNGLLAEGGFGKVYLGKFWGQEVAVKMLQRSLTPEERQEFLREVHIMSRLNSDYILPIYAVCDEPGLACIIMKYMANGSLRYTLEGKGHLLTPRERHQLALDIALGLYYLHGQDIMHRDLNSHNVLLDSEGRARLADFGLSKSRKGNIATIEKQGSALQWMAPEVCLGTMNWHAFTPQSDIYSYGVLLLEIMTGKAPAKDKSDDEFRTMMVIGQREPLLETLAPVYRKIIESCCQMRPADRPATMEGIILDLRNSFPAQLSLEGSIQRQIAFSGSAQNTNPISEDAAEAFYLVACQYIREKKEEKAVSYYVKAIAGGHIKAKTNLAIMYMDGKGGLPIDTVTAHRLLTEAARAGHQRAMENLIYLLKTGDKIPKNIDGAGGAIEWCEILARQGDKKAKQQLLSLRSQGSSDSASFSSSRLTLLAGPAVSASAANNATRSVKKDKETPQAVDTSLASSSSSSATPSRRK